jgi:tetratricopeptide (TPR) repeat protein
MPPRLTQRDLEERRLRVEEGEHRLKTAAEAFSNAVRARTERGLSWLDVSKFSDPAFVQRYEEGLRELEAAIPLLREGLPGTTLKVSCSRSRGIEWGSFTSKRFTYGGLRLTDYIACRNPPPPLRLRQLIAAMGTLGVALEECGRIHQALPILLEARSIILCNSAMPHDLGWVSLLDTTAVSISHVLRVCDRQEEALPVLQEAVDAQHMTGIHFNMAAPSELVGLLVELGRYEEAADSGRQALEVLNAPMLDAPRDLVKRAMPEEVLWKRSKSSTLTLFAALADACEALGRTVESTMYHNVALYMWDGTQHIVHTHEMFRCVARTARALVERGQVAEAEGNLTFVLDAYQNMMGGAGLGSFSLAPAFKQLVIQPLRHLVGTKRQLGKAVEARALEQDLDETEAIWAAMSVAAMQELREELRAEAGGAEGGSATSAPADAAAAAAAGGGVRAGAGAGAAPPKQKKLTRKQQKRRAAQRRRAEERVGAAGAAVVGGDVREGGGEEGEGGGGLEEMTAAAAQLSIEEEAAVATAATAVEEEEDVKVVVEAAAAEEEEAEAEAEAEECAICLGDLPAAGGDGAVLLACSHAFHTGCLERWKDKCLEKRLPYTCGLCRGRVVVVVQEGKEGKGT